MQLNDNARREMPERPKLISLSWRNWGRTYLHSSLSAYRLCPFDPPTVFSPQVRASISCTSRTISHTRIYHLCRLFPVLCCDELSTYCRVCTECRCLATAWCQRLVIAWCQRIAHRSDGKRSEYSQSTKVPT